MKYRLESARDSPMSEHSSHFDSVSGTAIHLGWNSRASSSDRGSSGIQVVPMHQPHAKMSSLAREARDCGPGLMKDSTVTRPALHSSAAPASTAREKILPSIKCGLFSSSVIPSFSLYIQPCRRRRRRRRFGDCRDDHHGQRQPATAGHERRRRCPTQDAA